MQTHHPTHPENYLEMLSVYQASDNSTLFDHVCIITKRVKRQEIYVPTKEKENLHCVGQKI